MELVCKQLAFVTFVYLLWQASGLRRYPITEEGVLDEYIVNIPQDLELPPISASDTPRRFEILSGGDKVVIRSNGDMHTKAKLDRETICPDNPPECVIDVEIGVVDTRFQHFKIQLVLEDVNDNLPQFPNNPIEKAISESSSIGSVIRLDSAIDPDLNLNSIQRYEMSGLIARGIEESNTVLPTEFPFVLNVFRNIDGTMIPELNLTKKLDRETVSSYELLLSSIDGGTPEQTGTATVIITVTDANDNKPTFSQPTFVVSVPEDVQPGYTVIQLEASDPDLGPNAEIEYSFSSVVSNQDREIFNIDRYTGIISVKNKLDYEKKMIHHLSVEAKDSREHPKTAYATVSVQVLDVNDAAPEITITYINAVQLSDEDKLASVGQPRSVLIRENTPIGGEIAFVSVTDEDTGISGNISCTLKDSSGFVMETRGSNRFLIKTNQELDREVKRFHNIEVDAWDFGSPPLSSTKSVVIELFDENDNDPAFIKDTYQLTARENINPGENIATLTAEDLDSGVNEEITYSAFPQPPDAVVPFAIRPKTGEVYFKEGATPLDAESKTKPFRLLVTATDNGIPRRNTSTNVVITIEDENDNSPKFKLKSYVFRIREDSKAGFYVGSVSADDDDVDKTTNGKIFYQFEQGNSAFSIKAETGQIYFVGNSGNLDREVRLSQPYVFNVIATDHGDEPRSDSCTVDIYIVDINDNSPVIVSPNVTSDIFFLYISSKRQTSSVRARRSVKRHRNLLTSQHKNSSRSSAVTDHLRIGSTLSSEIRTPDSLPILITKVNAEDLDEGENGRVRFAIEEGNSYNYFSIDPQTGKIFLTINNQKSLRAMHRGCHVIKINVKDLGKPVQQTFGWANIYVTDAEPGSVNSSKAMKSCMNNSFFPVEFLPPSDDGTLGSFNLYAIIIIAVVSMVFLLIIVIIIAVLIRTKCRNKESRRYNCKNGSVVYTDRGYQEGVTCHDGSIQRTNGEAGDNRASYPVDWAAAQMRQAQEKEEMLLHDRSNESVTSHNSGKDSGTGDSMPSDAYHITAAGGVYRAQYPNQPYRQMYPGQPSHVYLPPQDEVATTDEERRSYVSNQDRFGPKCTSDCRVRGHGDRCWMPDSLQRTSNRMTSFTGEFDGGSLKKRSMTPNSYQRQVDNMRYVPFYYEPVQNSQQATRGELTTFGGETESNVQPTTHYHPYVNHGHISQPPYTQSPIPFNTVSPTPYSVPKQSRGQQYVNLHGVTYEVNGVRAEEGQSNASGSNGSNQYQNYPISQNPSHHYYSPEQNYHLQYAPTYQAYGNDGTDQLGYYDDQGQYYGPQRTADNEFAASNLILSPADSEPGEYQRRLERQLTQQQDQSQRSYAHTGADPETERLLKSDNPGSKPDDDDASVAKLSTIREEMDADEVVAGIDRLLL